VTCRIGLFRIFRDKSSLHESFESKEHGLRRSFKKLREIIGTVVSMRLREGEIFSKFFLVTNHTRIICVNLVNL
jgi:hypothetical protein